MLESKINTEDPKLQKNIKKLFPKIPKEEMTIAAAMLASQINKAIKKGDSKAFETVRDTSGQKPKDTINLMGGMDDTVTIYLDDEEYESRIEENENEDENKDEDKSE